jgi:hypothetical protein
VFIGYFADTEFVKKFHYLMSDMNTHPEHSRQYLRAILIEAELRRAGLRPTEPLSRTAQQAVAGALRAVQPAATWAECA